MLSSRSRVLKDHEMNAENEGALAEIVAARRLLWGDPRQVIRRDQILQWAQSEDIEALGALSFLLFDPEDSRRIEPNLTITDYMAVELPYLERCLRNDPQSRFADSRWSADPCWQAGSRASGLTSSFAPGSTSSATGWRSSTSLRMRSSALAWSRRPSNTSSRSRASPKGSRASSVIRSWEPPTKRRRSGRRGSTRSHCFRTRALRVPPRRSLRWRGSSVSEFPQDPRRGS